MEKKKDLTNNDFTNNLIFEDTNDAISDHMGRLSQELLVEGDPIEVAKEEKLKELNKPKGYLKNTMKYEKLKAEHQSKKSNFDTNESPS